MVKKSRTIFSVRLREARKKWRWTQEELAEKVFIKRSTYNNYEAAFREPDLNTLVLLAKTLGVSTDWLLGVDLEEE